MCDPMSYPGQNYSAPRVRYRSLSLPCKRNSPNALQHRRLLLLTSRGIKVLNAEPNRLLLISAIMGDSILLKHLAEPGREGVKAWLKTMTAEERKASARKAGPQAQG
jgi:hypothetical protein